MKIDVWPLWRTALPPPPPPAWGGGGSTPLYAYMPEWWLWKPQANIPERAGHFQKGGRYIIIAKERQRFSCYVCRIYCSGGPAGKNHVMYSVFYPGGASPILRILRHAAGAGGLGRRGGSIRGVGEETVAVSGRKSQCCHAMPHIVHGGAVILRSARGLFT